MAWGGWGRSGGGTQPPPGTAGRGGCVIALLWKHAASAAVYHGRHLSQWGAPVACAKREVARAPSRAPSALPIYERSAP